MPKGHIKHHFYNSIRFKLMLTALSLFLIPWAGYRYIQENEQFLRSAQEDVLFGTAQTAAAMLRNQSALFISGATTSDQSADRFLYVHPLDSAIQVDGYLEDWLPYIHNASHYGTDHDLAFDLILAQDNAHLYILLQVEDDQLLFRKPGTPYPTDNDTVTLDILNPQGELNHYLISTISPGWADVHKYRVDEENTGYFQPQQIIKSEWQTDDRSYHLEIRIPRYLIGDMLSVGVRDVDDSPADNALQMLSTATAPHELNRLLVPNPTIKELIAGIAQENTRIWVVDRFHRVLARQGSLKPPTSVTQDEETIPSVLRMLLNLILSQPTEQFEDDYINRIQILGPEIAAALKGKPDTRRRNTPDNRAVVLSTTWPIQTSDGIVGAVLVEQTTNQILTLQNRAIEGLFGMTLLLFITTSLLLLGFATLLTGRVHRLRNRIEAAVTPDGRILQSLTPDKSRDEIGDLGRSFSSVLNRLKEYNRYLEAMASRLAHELRTPLTIVRSSLDNLAMESSPDAQQQYIERAKAGAERLAIILHRMREATRLEQLLQQTEMESFDLAQLLTQAIENYRIAFPGMAFELAVTDEPAIIAGAPDLISQALDKLISNARDFQTPGTPVQLQLQRTTPSILNLSIRNQGTPLPEQMVESIFDSMISVRDKRGDEPHLGLGLYLVRLICEFHGGSIRAQNTNSPTGVEFIIELPLVK